MEIKIGDIDVIAEPDLYRGGTALTDTDLWFSPEEKRVEVYQSMQSNGTTMRLYHRLELEMCISSTQYNYETPDGDELRKFLESEEGQNLLVTVAAHHEEVWNGNNWVGELDDYGKAAWDELERAIDDLPRSSIHSWFCEEYLGNNTLAELGLSVNSTHADVEQIASEIKNDAIKLNDIHLVDDVREYLWNLVQAEKEKDND